MLFFAFTFLQHTDICLELPATSDDSQYFCWVHYFPSLVKKHASASAANKFLVNLPIQQLLPKVLRYIEHFSF